MATYNGPSPAATQYGMFEAQARQALQQAQARIQQSRGDLLRQSGLEGVYGTDGRLTSVNVGSGADSQFGTYQTMNRDMGASAEGVDAAVQGTGFTGGGLSKQAVDAAQRQYEGQSAAWGQSVNGAIANLGSQDQQANADYNNSLFSDFMGNVQNAVTNGTFNPADYSGISIPGYDNPFAPAPGSSGAGPWRPPGSQPRGPKTSKYGNYNSKGVWVPWKPKKGGK